MTQPARWEPDRHMVAAVLSTPRAWRGMTQLADADRSWLVAGLTAAGMTAKDIAERLDCSLRLVRSIRAEPMTQLCELMLAQEREATDDLRAEKVDHMTTRNLLNAARAEANRFRLQLDQIVDKLVTHGKVDALPCGHPKIGWNTRTYVDKSRRVPKDRVACRTCESDRSSGYRQRHKTAAQKGQSHRGVTNSHPGSIGYVP